MRAALMLLLLLVSACADGLGTMAGDGARNYLSACAVPTLLEQPRERLADDTCWRVDVPDGFGLTETGGSCESAPACHVTRSTVVERQLLDWDAEGEDNPSTWREVRCDERCEQ